MPLEFITWSCLVGVLCASCICMGMSLIWGIFFHEPIENLVYAFDPGFLSFYAHDLEILSFQGFLQFMGVTPFDLFVSFYLFDWFNSPTFSSWLDILLCVLSNLMFVTIFRWVYSPIHQNNKKNKDAEFQAQRVNGKSWICQWQSH